LVDVLLILAILAQPTRATYYDPGLMELVARNRGLPAYVEPYIGGVALNDCDTVGQPVWISWPEDGSITGPYLVIDCPQAGHRAARLSLGLVIEVDAQTARSRGFFGLAPAPVSVLWLDPYSMATGFIWR